MQPPDWSLPFDIMCDSSDYAVSAILEQHKDKKLHAIYYDSKTLYECHINYASIKNELLAIVYVTKKICSYLVGSKIIVTMPLLGIFLARKMPSQELFSGYYYYMSSICRSVIRKRMENVVEDHLSRINYVKTKEFPLDDSFPDDRLLSFLRAEAPRYAHLTYYL